MAQIVVATLPTIIPTTQQWPPVPVNPVAATSYNFGPIDAQAYTVFTAATTINAAILAGVFPVGTQLTCEQSGLGSLIVTPGVGVTFNPTGPRGTLGQYAVIGFFQKFLNVWTCSGSFI